MARGELQWEHQPTPDNPASFGEGRAWVGTVARANILPDGRWRLEVPVARPPGAAFTATVTDDHGDTSEFSAFCADTDGNELLTTTATRSATTGSSSASTTTATERTTSGLGYTPSARRKDHRDVFAEVDWITNGNAFDKPVFGSAVDRDGVFHPSGLEAVETAFADAPATSSAEAGIALHLSPESQQPLDVADEAQIAAASLSFEVHFGVSGSKAPASAIPATR